MCTAFTKRGDLKREDSGKICECTQKTRVLNSVRMILFRLVMTGKEGRTGCKEKTVNIHNSRISALLAYISTV